MYNKLFSKIVTSSVWLEPTPTRIVWVMFLALMNEDGFVEIASIANVSHQARITEPEAAKAIEILESPDDNSADPDHEGRRIEKVPGGWMVLNAGKYREIVTREMKRERTRLRVAKHRMKRKCNAQVTQSDTDTDTDISSVPKKSRCSQKEAEEFCISIGLPKSDGTAMFLHWEEKGWAKVKDWQLTIRKWKSFGYLPSQKRNGNQERKKTAPTGEAYRRIPPAREVSDDERTKAQKQVRELTAQLREQFKMPE